MKITLLLSALVAHAFAEEPTLLEPLTPQALTRLQQIDPLSRLDKPAAGEAKIARPQDQSIIKQSTILHDAGHWTLVPIGAVIFMPAALKARLTAKPESTLLPWAEFLAKNYSWITTTEVTLAQAAGQVSLPADRVAFWAKQDKMVIAVHQNGPISVRVAPSTPP